MKTYVVKMSSVGNPDFGEDPKKPMSVRMKAECQTLKDCSVACLKYIFIFNLGAGNWSGGQVQVDGCQVARVSFNGRVWDMGDKEILI